MYKLYKCGIGNAETGVMKIDTDSITSFPMNPDNTDYQAYLAWLELGNEPLPAENT